MDQSPSQHLSPSMLVVVKLVILNQQRTKIYDSSKLDFGSY